MGMSAHGILTYGVNLGGPDGWELAEADEWNDLPEGHWLVDSEDPEGELDKRIEESGITGVTGASIGHGDSPQFLIVSDLWSVGYCGVMPVLPDALAEIERHVQQKPMHAARALGLTPRYPAQWYLAGAYS